MAIVTRRYALSGPSLDALQTFVSLTGASVDTSYCASAVDVNVDDSIDNIEETLDELMAQLGWVYSPGFTPRILSTVIVEADGAFRHLSTKLGFYGVTAITKPTVTGVRDGNTALASLLTELQNLGLIIDNTTNGVPQDGPDNWYVPESEDDFDALGLDTPDYLWLCQEVSGDLAAAIGGPEPLVASIIPPPLYEQVVTGWTRKFVGLDEQFGQFFRDAGISIGAGQSFALVCFLSMQASASQKRMFTTSLAHQFGIYMGSDGKLGDYDDNTDNPTQGTDVSDLAVVRQVVYSRNSTGSTAEWVSNVDGSKFATYEGAACVDPGLGAVSGVSSSGIARVCWFALYLGANAEQDWPTYLATLRG